MTLARGLVVMTPQTAARLGPGVASILRGARAAFKQIELVVANDPERLRRHIVELDPDVIVAAGGDGTVNVALQAMREQDSLAVLPLGTANDLARGLGVARNPRFIGSFVLASMRRIDVLRVNGQRFCTTGGLGLPAEVAHRVNVLRNAGRQAWMDRLGSHLYPVIAAELVTCGPPRYQLEITYEPIDGAGEARIELLTHGLFVCNQATFARTLQVVEAADNADGQFELCGLRASGRCELLRLLGHIVRHCTRPAELQTVSTRRAVIRVDREVRFFGDGEVLDRGREFVVEIEPGSLRLRV
jgi:diacylglycerol kinase (ATP)